MAAGLNPVLVFYEHSTATRGSISASGHQNNESGSNFADVPQVPVTDSFTVCAVCYRPRPGERSVPFQDVGFAPVEAHPRFDLDFDAPGSELKAGEDEHGTSRQRLRCTWSDLKSTRVAKRWEDALRA